MQEFLDGGLLDVSVSSAWLDALDFQSDEACNMRSGHVACCTLPRGQEFDRWFSTHWRSDASSFGTRRTCSGGAESSPPWFSMS